MMNINSLGQGPCYLHVCISQELLQCLIYSRCSIYVCWKNKGQKASGHSHHRTGHSMFLLTDFRLHTSLCPPVRCYGRAEALRKGWDVGEQLLPHLTVTCDTWALLTHHLPNRASPFGLWAGHGRFAEAGERASERSEGYRNLNVTGTIGFF